MKSKKSKSKKAQMKAAAGKDMTGMRQTYKQTGEVGDIKSSITSGSPSSLPRSNRNSKGGY